jgi:hypothetical protein
MPQDDSDAESRFIDERGGQSWLDNYINPFYRSWRGVWAMGRHAQRLAPSLRAKAFELSVGEISAMVQMHWRIQVVGTWYAIARADEGLSETVHLGLEHCYGSLTSPALATAVLTYPNPTTADALRAYRHKDLVSGDGMSLGTITAAVLRLDPDDAGPDADALSIFRDRDLGRDGGVWASQTITRALRQLERANTGSDTPNYDAQLTQLLEVAQQLQGTR